MHGNSAEERIVRRYRVSGHVQGVGFRWFVRERARAIDVAGEVCNDDDGAVVIDVAGSSEQITRIEDAIATGPQGAIVDGVSVLLDGELAAATLNALPYPFVIRR
ncbi:MAG: acylphosphatase [Gemmatimonas sp.]